MKRIIKVKQLPMVFNINAIPAIEYTMVCLFLEPDVLTPQKDNGYIPGTAAVELKVDVTTFP